MPFSKPPAICSSWISKPEVVTFKSSPETYLSAYSLGVWILALLCSRWENTACQQLTPRHRWSWFTEKPHRASKLVLQSHLFSGQNYKSVKEEWEEQSTGKYQRSGSLHLLRIRQGWDCTSARLPVSYCGPVRRQALRKRCKPFPFFLKINMVLTFVMFSRYSTSQDMKEWQIRCPSSISNIILESHTSVESDMKYWNRETYEGSDHWCLDMVANAPQPG